MLPRAGRLLGPLGAGREAGLFVGGSRRPRPEDRDREGKRGTQVPAGAGWASPPLGTSVLHLRSVALAAPTSQAAARTKPQEPATVSLAHPRCKHRELPGPLHFSLRSAGGRQEAGCSGQCSRQGPRQGRSQGLEEARQGRWVAGGHRSAGPENLGPRGLPVEGNPKCRDEPEEFLKLYFQKTLCVAM